MDRGQCDLPWTFLDAGRGDGLSAVRHPGPELRRHAGLEDGELHHEVAVSEQSTVIRASLIRRLRRRFLYGDGRAGWQAAVTRSQPKRNDPK